MKVHKEFSLKDILFYKIGGTARYVLEVTTKADILEAFQFLQKEQIKNFLVVGLGSNLLMHDADFDGAVIFITKPEEQDISITNEGLIEVFAGQALDDLIQFAFANSFVGLETLGGLPSTVGGAIRGNAGAFGIEMKDVVVSVEVLDTSSDQVKTLSNQECQFSYRESLFKKAHGLVILSGVFQLKKATVEEVSAARNVYDEKIAYRNQNHPVEYPSCGSVFKNIRDKQDVEKILSVWPDMREQVENKWHNKVSMGYAIKRLGFSGTQVGGAKITEKHANYISNVDNAKAADVLAIIEQIRQKFQSTFGFEPELEAEVVE